MTPKITVEGTMLKITIASSRSPKILVVSQRTQKKRGKLAG